MRFSQFTAIFLALIVGFSSPETLAATKHSRTASQTTNGKTVKKSAAAKKKTVGKTVKQAAKKTKKTAKKPPLSKTKKISATAKTQYGVKGALLQPVEVSNKTYRYQEKGKMHQTIGKEASRQYGQVGTASYYGGMFHGRKTASGDVFNENGYTAAHKTLALGSYALVTNLRNGRKVIVRINDRGPFSKERIIDLSKGAARELGMINSGVSQVRVEAMQVDSQGYISGKGAGTLYQLAQKEGLPLKVKNTNGDLAFKADDGASVLPQKAEKKAVKTAKNRGKITQKTSRKTAKANVQAAKKAVKTAKSNKKSAKKGVKTVLKKSKKGKGTIAKASIKKKK